jgi:GNAT superfamily N-acetyltransferase
MTRQPPGAEKLFSTTRHFLSKNGQRQLEKAYEFALESHRDQLRKSGEHFIEHPVAVAAVLLGAVSEAAPAVLHHAAQPVAVVGTVDIENLAIVHRFSYEVSTAENGNEAEIEQFMSLTHPGINKKWVKVALKNGDRCFIAKLSNEIAGLGWVSLVNGIGRLHSLYVKPQFRRIGIGEDILNARLLWLKSKRAHSVFTEISRYNIPSSNNVMKAHMKVSGQVFQYFKKDLDKKKEMKS